MDKEEFQSLKIGMRIKNDKIVAEVTAVARNSFIIQWQQRVGYLMVDCSSVFTDRDCEDFEIINPK